ncbi:TIGR01440 family protein [Clostridium sp. HBUAS56010]|uniref:TIGR01440 family protein n=1 Tax=Clostridium sp. HBUAS56010 TaxID=2571127 RepID=UPI0011789C9B|nr:TIGR01440 family protein [Clostridium sp. HBUAS56010]
MLEEIRQQAQQAAEELLEAARLKTGDLVVIGCSSSEISDHKIGSHSSAEIGEAVFTAIYGIFHKQGIHIAAQCCEHLNRALILEQETAERFGYEPVNVVPQLKAGGSFATAAYHTLSNPVAVEWVKAHAGIDIGDTLIGMHLRAVAVPVRLKISSIGSAHVVAARTRAKFIGGIRACYDDSKE